jgi:uncharacterized membrane protein YdjX (TVP38/TMEM64 family)
MTDPIPSRDAKDQSADDARSAAMAESPVESDTTPPNAGRSPGRLLAIGAALIALIVLARFAGGYLADLAAWVEGLGFWGPAAFVLIYASATLAFVPGTILTLAGGAIFGIAKGVVYVFIGAVLGSGGAFLVARHGARSWIEAQLSRYPRFATIDRAVSENGLKITFLLRLSPVFPFNFLNYALGLTQVSFRSYMIASLGMIPGTLLYVYYGRVIGDVAALAGGESPPADAGYYAVMALGLVATIAVTAVVTRIARKALLQAEQG